MATKAIKFGEKCIIRAITLFKIIQHHRGRYQSKARMRLPINDYYQLTSYLIPFRSYRSLLFKFGTLCVFEHPFGGGARSTYDVYLRLIGKRVVDFLLVLIEHFGEVLRLRRYERVSVQNRRTDGHLSHR